MNRTISPADMKRLEQRFMEKTGVPGALLMEHAAQGVIKAMGRHAPRGGRALFLCGPGNNGGDGYAAARLWQTSGGCSLVIELTDAVKGDARLNRSLAIAAGIRCVPAAEAAALPEADILVDALFGTGLSRAPEGDAARLIALMNRSGLPVVAVDIPSGLDGATGRALGEAVRAAETVTFHRLKDGLLLRDAPDYTGTVTVQPILIPAGFEAGGGLLCPSEEELSLLLAPRPRTAHKGTMGRVVIYAGSFGMAGAAAMCASACVKAGAGLTELLCRAELVPTLQQLVPAAVCHVLPEEGEAAFAARVLSRADAAVIGCGIGQDERRLSLLEVFRAADCPVVWDADALNLLARHPELRPLNRQAVLTPHPGEAARLLGTSVGEVMDEPLDALSALQQRFGCRVVLKGARTLMTDGADTAVCRYGSPALAKGGSGDTLSGILAALLARPAAEPAQTSMDAVMAAVLLHARMGEEAERRFGADTVTPEETLGCLRFPER